MPEQRDRGRPRPALLRALGSEDPPNEVTVGGVVYGRVETFKHDAWAATGLYCSPLDQIVCKFHRRHAILGLPMGWLGRWLARHERALLNRLHDLDTVPRERGPVNVRGAVLRNAVARDFVAGHAIRQRGFGVPVFEASTDTLDPQAAPPDCRIREYLAELEDLIRAVHARDAAYVDLHKYENIIVGADGRPWLIDFQISFLLPHSRICRRGPARWLLQILQRCDNYHLQKLKLRFCYADQPDVESRVADQRPLWIRLHRLIAVPVRRMRRGLLVAIGVRRGAGYADTEFDPEVARR